MSVTAMIITAIVAIASAASSTTSSARSFHVTHWPKIPGGWCLVGNDVKPCFFTQPADKTKSIITLTPSTLQTVSSTTTSARPFNVTHWPQILGGWCLIGNDVKPCFFTQAADKTKFPIITLTPRAFQTVASATRLNARQAPISIPSRRMRSLRTRPAPSHSHHLLFTQSLLPAALTLNPCHRHLTQ
jgi:hypothetical protein